MGHFSLIVVLDFLGFWVVFLQFVTDFVVDNVIEKQTHSQNVIAFLCFLMLLFQLVICIGYFSLVLVLFLSGVLGHVCLICGRFLRFPFFSLLHWNGFAGGVVVGNQPICGIFFFTVYSFMLSYYDLW